MSKKVTMNQTLKAHMERLGITWDANMPRLPLGHRRGHGAYVMGDSVIGETLADVERTLYQRVKSAEPCNLPMPDEGGTGVCIRCGWQHAPRGPNAVENQ